MVTKSSGENQKAIIIISHEGTFDCQGTRVGAFTQQRYQYRKFTSVDEAVSWGKSNGKN